MINKTHQYANCEKNAARRLNLVGLNVERMMNPLQVVCWIHVKQLSCTTIVFNIRLHLIEFISHIIFIQNQQLTVRDGLGVQ